MRQDQQGVRGQTGSIRCERLKPEEIFDAVFKKRSDGAMVRVMTPVPSDAPISVADERLKTLTARMDGFIADYVPN